MKPTWTLNQLTAIDDSQLGELSDVLIDCVDGGASVSFLHPLSQERALAFWRRVAEGVAKGDRAILVAVDSQGICGTVQLQFDQPENQPHRADLAKMLVHRRARRQGVGAALLAAAESVACERGRTLLVLDAVTGGDAARLYERMGWRRVGDIPGYALMPNGEPCSTTVYYRQLAAATPARPGSAVLSVIQQQDLADLRSLIETSIRATVAQTDDDARFLIDDVVKSLDSWTQTGCAGLGIKGCVREEAVGFIIVKDFWNLSHLFVSPAFQRRGVGRALVSAALSECRAKSPKGKVQVNSSASASPFYTAAGFVQTGPGIERPGGCIPFEYTFQAKNRGCTPATSPVCAAGFFGSPVDTCKILFDRVEWQSPQPGVRFKAARDGSRQVRFVEFTREFVEAEWCERGHAGFILSGELEIDFSGHVVRFPEGAALLIPAGKAHAHKARALTPSVRLFLVEDADARQ
jgi:GNAT superfamily N-acetyltransferase